MKRRCASHDYRSRCMYMVTLVVEGRRQLLGTLVGDPALPNGTPGSAQLRPSPLGEAVIDEWRALPSLHPEVRNMALQLMPDHLHLIVYVTRPMPQPLGSVVAAFEVRCNNRYQTLVGEGKAEPVSQHVTAEREAAKREGRRSRYGLLFENGFNDKILWREDELKAWRAYLVDNPRRLLLKRQHPDLFYVKHDIRAGGFTFEAMGNELLLVYPRRLFVQCSRKLTETDIAALLASAERDFSEGTVFVSSSVSPGEKAVMHRAFERRCPVVVLRDNGFGQYEKPGGRAFDACAEGRMLLLAPWQHHDDRRAITREQCLTLNAMAEAISTDRLL